MGDPENGRAASAAWAWALALLFALLMLWAAAEWTRAGRGAAAADAVGLLPGAGTGAA